MKFRDFRHSLTRAIATAFKFLALPLAIVFCYEVFIIPAKTSEAALRAISLVGQHQWYADYGGVEFANKVVGDSLKVLSDDYNWRD